MTLSADICQRAVRARDARFDGLFFVGITTTGVYCRPVCPSRVATPQHRRFFASPASAEHAGFRPCLRCRPELAPGRAQIDAVPRLARVAAHRIEAGALNGHSVGQLAGVEVLQGGRYGRTVRLDGCSGVVYAEDTAPSLRDGRRGAPSHLSVSVSSSLLAVLMPLLARLRHMFDLDAEPTAVDGHLACSGLGEHVRRRRGVRIPGVFDGFEAALRVLLRASSKAGGNVGRRVVHALGEPLETGIPALIRVAPTAERVADAGAARLASLGVRRRRAAAVSAVARAVADGALRLEPGSRVVAAQRALLAIDGIGDHLATTIVMRALRWPDAFPGSDRTLQRAVGASSASELYERAERWRPWRAYAALHLWMHEEERACDAQRPATRVRPSVSFSRRV